MLEIVKDRTLVSGQEVSVYRNLNRKCFSIKDKKTGLVCAYADKFRIENVKWIRHKWMKSIMILIH